MSTPSLDIVLGATWKVDARCLARLYAYSDGSERFDYSPILDIIDIVIDGTNITSRLPEESIFCVMQELVVSLSMILEGRIDKHIVVFPEAGWELAIRRADPNFELSFYGTGRPRQVTVHNVAVPQGQLVASVCSATERLLTDLVDLNGAFAREEMVRALEWQVGQLRSSRHKALGRRQTPVELPEPSEPVTDRVGDRRLGLEYRFDANHKDFWRYQGALVSDLHSLLFTGSLHLTYWGKRRLLGSQTYLFPLVEGLVAGAERLLQRLERQAGGCVILDGADGSESLLTAEVLDTDQVLLRVTEPSGAVGQTRTTPDQLFGVLLGATEAVLAKLVELNPRQVLNHRVNDLNGAVDRVRGQYFDIRRGDVYFEGVQGYLRNAPEVTPSPPEEPDARRMSVPLTQLRHLFLRSSWYLARNRIQFRAIQALGEVLLVPSEGRIDAVDRQDGRIVWSAPGDSLLLISGSQALLREGRVVRGLTVSDGAHRWDHALDGIPGSAFGFQLDGHGVACMTACDSQLVALDSETGTPLWHFPVEHGELVGATLAGPVLAVVADDGFAYGLNPNTGDLLWKVRIAGTCVLPPTYHEGRLYVCADADVGLEGVLYSIYPLTGRRVYERRAPATFSRAPLFLGGLGLFAMETPAHATIVAFDLEEGRPVWSMSIENAQVDTPVLTWVDDHRGGVLVIKTDTGQCHGVDVERGTLRWTTPLVDPGDILLTNLESALLDDHLVVAERFVSILEPRSGARVHRFDDLSEHPGFLHVDNDLRLILGEGDDHLECFDLKGFLALVE